MGDWCSAGPVARWCQASPLSFLGMCLSQKKNLSNVTQLYVSVEAVRVIFTHLTGVWETHYCFVSTPVKEPANTHPSSNTQSHHTLYNSLWHTKMHTMILVQAHTPTFPPNNPVDAFSLLCQVAFYNCSTMEKLITVDLESWLIDRASVLIASLLPGASEMAVNASHMTSVFWHSEKNTLLKLFTGILVERRHVYLGAFLRSDVFKPLVVVIWRAAL